jgi:hypothetical protein
MEANMKTRRREFLGGLAGGLMATRLAGAQTGGRGAPPVPVRKSENDDALQEPGRLSERDRGDA